MKYKYTLTNTNRTSEYYGNCEVCQRPVGEVYHQVEERQYKPNKWTQLDCIDLFGHKDCLESRQLIL